MIHNLGPVRHKYTARQPVVIQQPLSSERNLSDGSLRFYFGYNGLNTIHEGDADIVYTVRSKSNPGAANWCKHITHSLDYSMGGTEIARMDLPSASIYYDYCEQHSQSKDYHTAVVGGLAEEMETVLSSDFLGPNAQAYINDAATRLRPDLTKVSVPNFLADILSIKALIKLWQFNLSLAKNLAGAHLNYKFGWRPTIGDIQGAYQAVKSLHDKIAAFEKSVGSIQSGRVTCLNENITKSGVLSFHEHFRCFWKATLYRAVTGYVVWQPQHIAVMSGKRRVLKGLLDSLGFQLNPRILWDALPFSFIIDWFFNVGKVLDTFSIDTLELPIKYVDSYLQLSQTLKVESFTQYQLGGFTANGNGGYTSGGWITRDKLFMRVPIFPDYSTLAGLGWKIPTFGQALLMLSLATVLKK